MQIVTLLTVVSLVIIELILQHVQFSRNIGVAFCPNGYKDPLVGARSVSGLNFLQINIHHSEDANVALVDYVNNFDIDCVLAQDPYVRGTVLGGVPDSWVSFSSTNLNAFILFTNTDYTVVNTLKLNNSVFANLTLDNDKFIIIGSQYSSPSSDLENDFDEWTSELPITDNLILGVDLNVHLKALGYAREDLRTETFLETLVANNLFF